ncbi:MAG: glycosyltransferase family 39 protein [Candidatus Geothermincolales bacterium]
MEKARDFFIRFPFERGEHISVLVFFLLLTLVFTWPLALHLHDGVLGGTGDPMLNTWIITNGIRKLFTCPGAFFQGNIIYPSRDVVAYSEHLFSMALLATPIYLVSRNPLFSYNILLVLGAVFSAWGTYLLLKELTGSRWAGVVAGAFFALSPYKISHVGHLQIMFTPFLPFCLLFLVRAAREGGWKNFLLFGLTCAGQLLYSWHQAVYGIVALGFAWLWLLMTRGRGSGRRLVACLAVLMSVGFLTIPFAIPYLRAHRRLPVFERSLLEVRGFSCSFGDFLNVLPQSVFYGEAPDPFRAAFIAHEKVLFPGVTIILLALAGLLFLRKEDESRAHLKWSTPFFLLLGVLSLVFCFGERIGKFKNYLFIALFKTGFLRFSRVPARFFILVSLSLAVLAGWGVARILRLWAEAGLALPMRRFFALGLVTLLSLEIATFNLPVIEVTRGGRIPEVYRWLQEIEGARVVELPTLPLAGAGRYDRYLDLLPENPGDYFAHQGLLIYYSLFHRRDTLNGYSGYFSPWYNRIFTELQSFPSPRAISLLQGLGVTHVVWYWDIYPLKMRDEMQRRLESQPELKWVGDFENRSVYQLVPGNTMSDTTGLEVEVTVPEVIRPGSPFVAGLQVINVSDRAFVQVIEDRQPVRLTFLDGEGNPVSRAESHYWCPFFLEPGERQVAPVFVKGGLPGEGDYLLRIEVDGVLGPREFQLPVRIEEMADSEDPQRLEGRVEFTGEETVRIPSPEGLYPLTFKITNLGDTYWVSGRASKVEEVERPTGLVHLALRWEKEAPLWEEQRGTLPCDLAPGQQAVAPTLVRPPREPGRYKLFVGLADEGYSWFGNVVVLDVEVGGK